MPLILLNFQGKICSALNSHLEFLLPQLPIVREILVLHVLILKQTREKLTGNCSGGPPFKPGLDSSD